VLFEHNVFKLSLSAEIACTVRFICIMTTAWSMVNFCCVMEKTYRLYGVARYM